MTKPYDVGNVHVHPWDDGKTSIDVPSEEVPKYLAAPEMLKALKRIIAHESRADRRHSGMVDISELRDLQRIARIALAKAEVK